MFLKYLRCQSTLNTYCEFTCCPLSLSSTSLQCLESNKRTRSRTAQPPCKLVEDLTHPHKLFDSARGSKSGVLLRIACSVFLYHEKQTKLKWCQIISSVHGWIFQEKTEHYYLQSMLSAALASQPVRDEGKQVWHPSSQIKFNDSFFSWVNHLKTGAERQSTLHFSAILTLGSSLILHKPPFKQNRSDWIMLDSSLLVLSRLS